MDTHLVQITDLVKDYAKIIDELREENRVLKEKNIELNASSFWKQREELKEENRVLRQAICDIATNLGNGSSVSPAASLPFIKELPHEVKLVCDGLRKELAREKKTCNNLREELQNPPPDVQEKVLNMLGVYKGMVDLIERYNELKREVKFYLKEFPHYNGIKAFEKILKKHDEQTN